MVIINYFRLDFSVPWFFFSKIKIKKIIPSHKNLNQAKREKFCGIYFKKIWCGIYLKKISSVILIILKRIELTTNLLY